jgi:colicin import membrane protein
MKPFLSTLFLHVGILVAVPAYAAGNPADAQQADWEERLARAGELQRAGAARKDEAEKAYAERLPACYEKFLVNRCLEKVHAEKLEAVRDGRRIENEGKALERQVKKEQLSARDLQQAAEASQREAELKAREADTAAAREQAAQTEAAKRADQARKAEEGARRKAAEAAQFQQKQAEHAARVAEQKAKAERDAAAKSGKP